MSEPVRGKRRRIGWEMYMGDEEEENQSETCHPRPGDDDDDDLEIDEYNPFGEPVRLKRR